MSDEQRTALDAAAEARRVAMLAEWAEQDAAARIVAAFPELPMLAVDIRQSPINGRFYVRVGKASRMRGYGSATTLALLEERTIAKLRRAE